MRAICLLLCHSPRVSISGLYWADVGIGVWVVADVTGTP